jgi:UMF1 family MFS transporter
MVRESTRETIATLRSGSKYPGLVRFLVGRVFYTDAINTVINVMTLFAVNVATSVAHLSEKEAHAKAYEVMLFAIVFAVVGGFFWGWITDRHGPRAALNFVLRAWMGVFVAAALIGIVGLPLVALYAVAAAAGFSLGGVWAADRTYMLRLAPPSRIGEFYGLYGMVGRFAAITGPAVWAIVTYVTNERMGMEPRVGEGIAVIFLLGMVVLGYSILQPVSDKPREWSGEDLI